MSLCGLNPIEMCPSNTMRHSRKLQRVIQVQIKKAADNHTELKRSSNYIDCSLFADTLKCCPCFASKCPPREIAAENLLYLAVTLMLFKLIILNGEAVLDVSPKLCLG